MGSLSNLYISQSYQSLIHLATNNTASATLIDLQDGLGNSIGVSVNTNGDLFLSGSLTASLQQGYLYVGGANGKTYSFPTSSLVTNINTGSLVTTASFNQYTQSNNQKWDNLAAQSGSWITESETGSFAYINKDNNWSANQTFTNITAVSASFTYVQTTYETSSVIYSSGSNIFGDELTDTQTLSGSVKVQGSLTVNGTPVQTSSVDISSLNAFTASQNTKNTTLENVTASLQQFTASNGNTSLNLYTQSNDAKWNTLGGQTGSYVTSAITASSLVTASVNLNTITFTKGDASTFNITVNTGSGTTIDTGSFVTTSSFNSYTSSTNSSISNLNLFTASNGNTSLNSFTQSILGTNAWTASIDSKFNTLATYTASNDTKWNTLGTLTGSYATTGSNVFTGIQTFRDAAQNATSLVSTSGSLMLVAKSYTSASAHITGSTGNLVNFIFKDNNNTGDTVLSGSNNIFGNPVAPTAGFKRFASNGNIALYGALPQISSSMAFPISMNGNFLQTNTNNITLRGPVSASAWTIAANFVPGTINIGVSAGSNAEKLFTGLTISANYIQGGLNLIANQNALTSSANTFTQNFLAGTAQLELSSSALNFTNNIINDAGFILRNQFYNGTPGLGVVQFIRNNIAGTSQIVQMSGSQPAGTTNQPSYNDNAIFGGANIIYGDVANARTSGTTAYHSALRNVIMGNTLIVSASSAVQDPNSYGSVFAGRYNAIDGRREKTSDNIFVVGTGTNTAKKTGFLIDSGSNTFVEGTFNVSGSTSISGSTSMTGSLTLFSSSVTPSDLIMYGHKMFNVGAFQDTTTQSGSANTAYAFKFNTTDISQGVAISGSTGLRVTNAGTYNVQWSGQLVNGASQADVTVWLRKNGTNIDGTGGRVTIPSNTNALPAWNYVVNLVANDTIEIMWGSTDANTTWAYLPAATIYPACASIIVTVTQVR